jgi:hypothetical protein
VQTPQERKELISFLSFLLLKNVNAKKYATFDQTMEFSVLFQIAITSSVFFQKKAPQDGKGSWRLLLLANSGNLVHRDPERSQIITNNLKNDAIYYT